MTCSWHPEDEGVSSSPGKGGRADGGMKVLGSKEPDTFRVERPGKPEHSAGSRRLEGLVGARQAGPCNPCCKGF